ncbi:MAG: sigma-70 family RNA polymerase sigma factor [Chloroflexi bacterium]|nr:sigma-70 family RNA polymerase sigma factor [Chloroflexota bacterium]
MMEEVIAVDEVVDETARRARSGDQAALAQLYQQLRPVMRACIARQRGGLPAQAEWQDLEQEGYLVLADVVSEWKCAGPFQAWFWRVFPWRLRRSLRRLWPLNQEACGPDELTALAEQRQARRDGHGPDLTDVVFCRQLLRLLPSPYRSVIYWRFYEGLTFAEIEELHGVVATTAHGRCQRALRFLRAHANGHRVSRADGLGPVPATPIRAGSDSWEALAALVSLLWGLAEEGQLLPAATIVCRRLGISQRRYERLLRRLRGLGCLEAARGVSFASRQGRRLRLACSREEALRRLAGLAQ